MTVTMRQRILDVLGESSLPVPTSDLIAICATGLSYPRSRVWTELTKLESRNVIARAHWRRKRHEASTGGTRELLWTLA